MTIETRAIVLNKVKYGEGDLVVTLYSEACGRISILVKSAFRGKGKHVAGFYEVLQVLEGELHYRESRGLQRFSNIRLALTPINSEAEILKSFISIFIGEVLHRSLRDESGNPEMFDFLLKIIETLSLCQDGLANFPILFLAQYARFLGIRPTKDELKQHLSTAEHELLESIISHGFGNLTAVKATRTQRNRLTEGLLDFFAFHLPEMGKIKSLSILSEVLNA